MAFKAIKIQQVAVEAPHSSPLYIQIKDNFDALYAGAWQALDGPLLLASTWTTSWTAVAIQAGGNLARAAVVELQVAMPYPSGVAGQKYATVEVKATSQAGNVFASVRAEIYAETLTPAWAEARNMVVVAVEAGQFMYRCGGNVTNGAVNIVQIGYVSGS
ncbi:MAG: hypothetical protein A2V67_19415 [Deltaproteobacteria bacterium RBG_13_61_14]|nr:MAG: hypothetical protein A2V67_19415 [Deltaproteobacteria bacterium RBG_13_61_14]